MFSISNGLETVFQKFIDKHTYLVKFFNLKLLKKYQDEITLTHQIGVEPTIKQEQYFRKGLWYCSMNWALMNGRQLNQSVQTNGFSVEKNNLMR